MWIAEWLWDDDNVEHIARHGMTTWDVRDVWLMSPKFRRNRNDRAATHQMIGPDKGGRFFAVFRRAGARAAGPVARHHGAAGYGRGE